ncbi:MAG: LamG-like jellyroll fold domain-containing protein [Planctomycetota bacterium]
MSTAPLRRLARCAVVIALACANPWTATPAAQITLPSGFVDEFVLSAGESPASLKFSPAGDLYYGLRIRGELWRVPFGQWGSPRRMYTFDVPPSRHRSSGLRDFTFSDDGRFLFAFYMKNSPRHNRVVRLTVDPSNPDRIVPGSETLLLDLPFNGSSSSGSHNGGALEIGGDGLLYVTTGDGWSGGDGVQSLSTYTGKVFRIGQDGSIPPSNPFYSQATGPLRATYCLGMRNPFSMSLEAATGRLYLNETLGSSKDELFQVAAGANFGHQGFGGIGTSTAPWASASTGTPLNTGGAWYDRWRFATAPPLQWPAQYFGGYFVCQWGANGSSPGAIVHFPAGSRTPRRFAGSVSALDSLGQIIKPVCVRVGPDGHLYYLMTTYETGGGVVHRIRWTGGSTSAAAPVLTPPGGSFAGPVAVSMSSTTAGASIHYTTSGAVPTQASPRYSGVPITVSQSQVIAARTFAPGVTPSPTTQASYAITVVQNQPPVAIAGPRHMLWPVDRRYTLNGSASYDPDGSAALLREQWVQTGGPVVPGFDGSDFVSFFTPAQVGTYTFRLDVCDPKGACDADSVSITVVPCIDDVLDGLANRWLFEGLGGGLAYDSSPAALHGTLNRGTGAASRSAYPAGTTAVALDGVDGAVQLPSELDLSGNAATVTAWFWADDFGVSDARLLSKASGDLAEDHYLMLSTWATTGGMRLRFRLKTGGTTGTLVASSGTLSVGRWIHVAAVYDGSEMRLFQDGALVGRMPKSGTITAAPGVPAAIGNQPSGIAGGARPFDGLIDDVRIYDRMLTQSELDLLRSASRVLQLPAGCSCQADIGFGGPGNAILTACGGTAVGSRWDLRLTDAPPSVPLVVTSSSQANPLPLFGGTWVAQPSSATLVVGTDAAGRYIRRSFRSPGGPATFVLQALYLDSAAPEGVGISNAVRLTFR